MDPIPCLCPMDMGLIGPGLANFLVSMSRKPHAYASSDLLSRRVGHAVPFHSFAVWDKGLADRIWAGRIYGLSCCNALAHLLQLICQPAGRATPLMPFLLPCEDAGQTQPGLIGLVVLSCCIAMLCMFA